MRKSAVIMVFAAMMPGVAFASAATPCPFAWLQDHNLGESSSDILQLQRFLNSDPATVIAESGPGSPGSETPYFGSLTKRAIVDFQNRYSSEILQPSGLKSGNGRLGPATRAKLNALCAANPTIISPTTPKVLGEATTTVSDALTVTGAEQPASSLAPQGALYVPFTNVTLAAGSRDVIVNSITVERTGPGSDTAFDDIEFLDEDGSGISFGGLDANHQVKLHGPLTIPAGTSRTISIVGDMTSDLSAHGGERPALQLDAIDATSPIEGLFPIVGTQQIVNSSLTIGTASAELSPFDPDGESTRYISDTGVRFAGIKVTAGSQEDIRINSITWEQSGSASSDDLRNVVVVADGQSYPTEVDGRKYTATFPSGIILHKGLSSDLYIKGDILPSAANRTARFDLRYGSDVDITGLTYGFGIALYPDANTDESGDSVFLTSDGSPDGDALTPFFQGSTIDISPGVAVSIQKA